MFHGILIGLALVLVGCATLPTLPPAAPPEQSVGQPPAFPAPPAIEPPAEAPVVAPPPVVHEVPAGAREYALSGSQKIRVMPAVGAMPSVRRAVQLYRKDGDTWQLVNEVNVPHLPGGSVKFWVEDLPGFPGAIILEAARNQGVRHGAVAVVNGELVALDYHRLAAPIPEVTEGVYLFVNKYMNQLWAFRDGALVATYPTANGRDPWGTQPTWDDLKTNYKTPEGLFTVRSKIVNPPYESLGGNHPPAAGGAPNNPLGTRWIGFEVLSGDGGGIWGLHGTYVPEQIGTWASEGCIRLNNKDIEQLYDLVPMGAKIRIVNGI